MLKRICLIALLTTGLLWADDRADYERMNVDLQEQRRSLNRLHLDRRYSEAAAQQAQLALQARETLDFALGSSELDNSKAWESYAKICRDIGQSEQALKATEEYLKTPLLDRDRQRGARKLQAQIHRRAKNYDLAETAYLRALQLADRPLDIFHLRRDLANLELRSGDLAGATEQAQEMRALLSKIDSEKRLSAERSLQSLLLRVSRQTGDSETARAAKRRQLELRQQQVERELQEFEYKYPASVPGGS